MSSIFAGELCPSSGTRLVHRMYINGWKMLRIKTANHSSTCFLPRTRPMVLSSKSPLFSETSTPPSDTPVGTTYQSRADNPRNAGREDEGDHTPEIPETTLHDKWSSLFQVDLQSLAESETFQVVLISLAARVTHLMDPGAGHVVPLR